MIKIWAICREICSRRSHRFLPEMVTVLERHGELKLSVEAKRLLLRTSRTTVDRCLKSVRQQPRRGLSTTNPGTLLKQAIPVRTFAKWQDTCPDFVEIDLVTHWGDSAHGEYLNT